MAKRVVLAYSGGLDTSVAVRWMQRGVGVEVIALRGRRRPATAGDWDDDPRARARRRRGRGEVVDAREEFADDFLVPALKANALYEGKYPLVSALSRPVIVEAPRRRGPRARRRRGRPRLHRQGQRPGALRGVDARARPRPRGARARCAAWGMTREDCIDYADDARHPDHGDEGEAVLDRREPLGPRHRVRRDGGPVGRAAARRVGADRSRPRPSRARSSIGFEQGVPVVARRRRARPLVELDRAARTASSASYGWGRIDMVENRRVGIKSRETYECPASARADPRPQRPRVDHARARPRTARRPRLEPRYAELIYDGLWFSPLKQALDAFVDETPALRDRRGAAAPRARAAATSTGRRSRRTASTTTTSPPTTPTTRSATRTPTGFVRLWGLGVETWAAPPGPGLA